MHLLVMVKEPRPGRVKTRLCPPCTPQEAADLAAAAIADTLRAVAGCGADRRLVALEGRPGPWLPEGFEVTPQGEGTLGQRLDEAWSAVDGPCLQIGMDTPQVDAPLLDTALDHLAAGAECVLGDATDGGWWAIGLQHPVPEMFAPVPTSRSDTGTLQRQRCRELGLAITDLPTLTDVDHVDDAVAVACAAPSTEFARAVTRCDLERRASAAAAVSAAAGKP